MDTHVLGVLDFFQKEDKLAVDGSKKGQHGVYSLTLGEIIRFIRLPQYMLVS